MIDDLRLFVCTKTILPCMLYPSDQFDLQIDDLTPLSPFTISYHLDAEPAEGHINEADAITMAFLRPFMYSAYDDALDVFGLARKSVVVEADGTSITLVPHVKFLSTTVEATEFHIMGHIRRAFTEAQNVENYIQELHNSLDQSNPFQQVSSIQFYSSFLDGALYDAAVRQKVHSKAKASTKGVAGAFAGAFLVLAVTGYVIHGRLVGDQQGSLTPLDKLNGITTGTSSSGDRSTVWKGPPAWASIFGDPRIYWQQQNLQLHHPGDASVVTASSHGEDDDASAENLQAWRYSTQP